MKDQDIYSISYKQKDSNDYNVLIGMSYDDIFKLTTAKRNKQSSIKLSKSYFNNLDNIIEINVFNHSKDFKDVDYQKIRDLYEIRCREFGGIIQITNPNKILFTMGQNQTLDFFPSTEHPSSILQSNQAENHKAQPNPISRNKIFISHSNKDKTLVNNFCENILHFSLNIDLETQIFNTSLDGAKPDSGEDFRERIKNEIVNASHVLQFISKNYKSSEVCLNEMGAAWVLNSKVIPLILEPGGYDVGFLNSTKQQVKLNDKNSILHLIETLANDLSLKKAHLARISEKVDDFVKLVNNTYSDNK